MNKKILYLATVLGCAVALNSCDEPENNHPIVGTWETTDPTGWEDVDLSRYLPPGNDYGYSGTWRFEKDGSYHLDYYSGSMGGAGEGSESGTFEFVSDSIMTLHRTDYDSVGYVINEAWGDTLHMVFIDSRLVTTRVDSFAPFTFGDQSFYWQRVDQ